MVVAALNTGMRRGELMNLEWNDVDFGRNQILVRHSNDLRYAHLSQPHKQRAVETLAGSPMDTFWTQRSGRWPTPISEMDANQRNSRGSRWRALRDSNPRPTDS
ncbi:MAG TPA: tyrosine-type recombinase/integrase [bacterium]